MSRIRRFIRWMFLLGLLAVVIGGIGFAILYLRLSSGLPDPKTLRAVELQEPLYVYAADGRLMALFGEKRRYPVTMAQVPKRVKDAFLAAEDARFYEHEGVDYKGVGRAVWQMVFTDKERVAGGSTITQQVARQFFLSNEYRIERKLKEMLLARKMEQELSKDEIFELYLNNSFFGNRAYGVAAAAEYYYGKTLDQLDLDEAASLASIPKFPTAANPISNPVRARERRDVYVLKRMRELGMITAAEEAAARAVPMHASPHEKPVEVYAPFIAEMVRQQMLERFGEDALERGYHVTTTIDPTMQVAADRAVRDGLHIYDHRHGWNPKSMPFLELGPNETAADAAKRLSRYPVQGELLPALVLATRGDAVEAVLGDGTLITIGKEEARWPGRNPATLLKRGDVTRVRRIVETPKTADAKGAAAKDAGMKGADAKPTDATSPEAQATAALQGGPAKYRLDQIPRAQAALVSLDADTGAVRALVGGYSFAGSKFNTVTQARRQPGSSFKPFIYAAAFERGYNPASIVLDAPVVFRMGNNKVWRPQNDGGGFSGPGRVREALVRSRNLVSVRMLDAIGVEYARDYITQFGFDKEELPPNLSISLGTPSLTPMSIARGYAVFTNGGFRVDPWIIDEVRDSDDKVIYKHKPVVACRGCTPGTALAGQQAASPAANVVDGFNLGPTPTGQPAAAGSDAAKPDPAQEKKKEVAAAKPLPPGTQVAPRAIDERIAYQMVSMMRDVVLRGTATEAKRIGREDVGGKTGSTNDHRDAWFSGTGGNLVTTVWVGKSDNTSLGYREYGGKAALPIWIDFMKVALKDMPIAQNEPPANMVRVVVSGDGRLMASETGGGIVEYVKAEDLDRMENFVDYGDYGNDVPDEEAFDIF